MTEARYVTAEGTRAATSRARLIEWIHTLTLQGLLFQHCLRVRQVGGAEAFGKPGVGRGEALARVRGPSVLAPQAGDRRQLFVRFVLPHRRMLPNADFLAQPIFHGSRKSNCRAEFPWHGFRPVCEHGQLLPGASANARGGPPERDAYNNCDLSGG